MEATVITLILVLPEGLEGREVVAVVKMVEAVQVAQVIHLPNLHLKEIMVEMGVQVLLTPPAVVEEVLVLLVLMQLELMPVMAVMAQPLQ